MRCGAELGLQRPHERLLPFVYEELRRLAALYMSGERRDHTLQPTALVHEAYLRLVDQRRVDWKNRAQFVGVAATMMRRILLNHARDRGVAKRGGSSRGDLFVTVSVNVPTKLTKEQKELIARLGATFHDDNKPVQKKILERVKEIFS